MSASTTPAATPAKRTRTGCKTCRQRKLKCDEVKPICGQCRKSNRECQPSEGIAFRHAQNAGFTDGDGTEKDLANFYKYRQKFNNTYFLPVPRDLSFIHVTDPYAEEPVIHHHALPRSQQMPPPPPPQSTPQYADVAATSLKAMIDPNLEQSSSDIKVEQHGPASESIYPPTTSAEMTEADRFHETIIQALREDPQTRDVPQASV